MVNKGELDSSQKITKWPVHMRKCSPSLVTKEMEIRTTMNTADSSTAATEGGLGESLPPERRVESWSTHVLLRVCKLLVFTEDENADTLWLTLSLLSYYVDTIG